MFINIFKNYKIFYKESAKKDLKKIPANIASLIDEKLTNLVNGANDLDIIRLQGYKFPTYRMRIGKYRTIFEKYQNELVILVIEISHRKDAYE